MTKWKVPLFELDLGVEESEALQQVVQSNWITMGEGTRKFEKRFAEYIGVKHAFGVGSGTAALHLAHHVAGIGPGDEVICPSLTFVATANTIVYTGATPVFCDVTNLDDLTLSPSDVASKITDRTKGIVVVHYAGFPCDMDGIMEVARAHHLYVVEDVAHAPGATYMSSHKSNDGSRFKKLGTIGDMGCFSFFGNKNLTTGEGGMIVTNNDRLAEKVRTARSHGMTSLTWDRYKGHHFTYDVVNLGYNYRLDDLRAALGLVQLEKLDDSNKKRAKLWRIYKESLERVEGVAVPFSNAGDGASYHIFPVILSEEIDRNSVMKYLKLQGIQTSIHYRPIHTFSYYKGVISKDYRLNITEKIGNREVTLPLFPTMKASQVEFVVEQLAQHVNKLANLR